MNNSKQDELQKYLAEKARQEEEKEQESEPFSEYEACVLRESARVRELVAEAMNGLENE